MVWLVIRLGLEKHVTWGACPRPWLADHTGDEWTWILKVLPSSTSCTGFLVQVNTRNQVKVGIALS